MSFRSSKSTVRLACLATIWVAALALPSSPPSAAPARGGGLHLRGGKPSAAKAPPAPAAKAKPVSKPAAGKGGKDAVAATAAVGGVEGVWERAEAVLKRVGIVYDEKAYLKVMEALTLLFPLWTVACALAALYRPALFGWISTDPVFHVKLFGAEVALDAYTLLLSVIMMSIGTTLDISDFLRLQKHLAPLAAAWFLQYLIKPVLGFSIARLFRLRPPYTTGLILLSCCPAAQAANPASFIAGGDLPTSMALTLSSTAASFLMTPLLLRVFANRGTQKITMDGRGIMLSLLKVVMVPTAAGMAVHRYLPELTKRLRPVTPLFSVIATACLCAAPVAGTSAELLAHGLSTAVPVILLQSLAVLAGYLLPRRVLGLSEASSRSVAMQTAMQSAAMGFLLATRHFEDPSVAIPPAVGVLVMSCLGSVFAVAWRLSDRPK